MYCDFDQAQEVCISRGTAETLFRCDEQFDMFILTCVKFPQNNSVYQNYSDWLIVGRDIQNGVYSLHQFISDRIIIFNAVVEILTVCNSIPTHVGIGVTGCVSARRYRCRTTTVSTVARTHTLITNTKYSTVHKYATHAIRSVSFNMISIIQHNVI